MTGQRAESAGVSAKRRFCPRASWGAIGSRAPIESDPSESAASRAAGVGSGGTTIGLSSHGRAAGAVSAGAPPGFAVAAAVGFESDDLVSPHPAAVSVATAERSAAPNGRNLMGTESTMPAKPAVSGAWSDDPEPSPPFGDDNS